MKKKKKLFLLSIDFFSLFLLEFILSPHFHFIHSSSSIVVSIPVRPQSLKTFFFIMYISFHWIYFACVGDYVAFRRRSSYCYCHGHRCLTLKKFHTFYYFITTNRFIFFPLNSLKRKRFKVVGKMKEKNEFSACSLVVFFPGKMLSFQQQYDILIMSLRASIMPSSCT